MRMFIFQGNDHDCGFAALKMLLANLTRDKSYLHIPKPRKREKFNLEDLEKIALSYGLKIESSGCNDEYYNLLKAPLLTLIDQNHVVMVKKVTKRKIILYDPDLGIVRLKRDDFLCRWRKIVIEVTDKKSIKKIPKIRRNILPTKLRIFEAACSVISSAILIGVFYLLNNQENAIFSLLFVGLFMTFQIVENFILYREIYQFDKKFIRPYFYQSRNKGKEKYKEFVEFKKNFFTGNRGFLSSILIAFLITFLLCLNDFKNIFVLLTLILVKLLELFLFSDNTKRVRMKIAKSEQRCINYPEQAAENAMQANALANSQVLVNSFKQASYMIFCFVFALLMMLLTKNTGCNYVIFHFVLYYTGSTAFNQIIENLSNRKEKNKIVQRFLDRCNF